MITVPTYRRVARAAAPCALALLLGVCATSVAAEKAIWGPTTLADGRSALALYEELGIDTLQIQLKWSQVAPTRPASPVDPGDPAYQWPAELDRAVSEADRYGIRLALQILDTPGWANGAKPSIWAPDDVGDYAKFTTAAARRYRYVRRWMIWVEPNKDDRFQPNRNDSPISARTYAPLLDAAYGALKAANPRNVVIGGMTWTGGTVKPADFVRFMRLPNGRPPRLDWFGHNPFPYRFPDIGAGPIAGEFRDISDTDTFSREVRQAYRRPAANPVPLWLSEYTIQSGRPSEVFATFASRRDQARYLTAGLELADGLGEVVAGIGWLSLLDERPSPTSANWGLLTHALERKPAFEAMAAAPGERLRPTIEVEKTVRRAKLRDHGLEVGITPRAAGPITVELRRGSLLRAGARTTGTAGRTRTVRLRASLRPGRYTIRVRAARASTVRRAVRVR